ncbi:hypothetical protein Q8F55_007818 [Vanrija albida]|uniref:Uncharacterized protein n=1 Tax=Vanrija albida TaxID=181172 RepID=A0ABR3PUL1_9TREE
MPHTPTPYGATGVVSPTGVILDFPALDCGPFLPSPLPLRDLTPALVAALSPDALRRLALGLAFAPRGTLSTGTMPRDIWPRSSPRSLYSFISSASSSPGACNTPSPLFSTPSPFSTPRRSPRSTPSSSPPRRLRPRAHIAPLTFALLLLAHEPAAAAALFLAHPAPVARDIREAALLPLLPAGTLPALLTALQERILANGTFTSDALLAPAAQLLVAALAVPDDNVFGADESVQRRLETLFALLPRVAPANVRFYGVRVGLVFAALGIHEAEAYERRARGWALGAAAVSAGTGTAARLPAISGVNVTPMIEPLAVSVRGAALDAIGRKQRKLGAGVGLVAVKFSTQVLDEAGDGLCASFACAAAVGGAVHDEHGNVRRAFAQPECARFADVAWRVFSLVPRLEGFDVAVTVADPLSAAPAPTSLWARVLGYLQPEAAARITVAPRISSDVR